VTPQSVLSQDEVEALLELVESERGAAPSADDTDGGGEAAVVKRDFSKPDRLPKEDYLWIQGEASHAGTRVGEALTRWLQLDIRVECVAVETQRYQAFLGSLASPCLVFPFACGGQSGALAIDPAVVLAAVDRVLGGTGKSRFVARTVTSVEMPIGNRFAACALQAFAEGLSDVVAMAKEPSGGAALHVRQARFVGPERKCLVLTYSVAGDVAEAQIQVVLPAMLFQAKGNSETNRPAVAPPPSLPGVGVEVAARMAETTITLADLLALERGDVVTLDAEWGDPAVIEVEGRAVATASIGTVDENFAFCIDTIIPHKSPSERKP
jgi:flagellar motor switch protein FliM